MNLFLRTPGDRRLITLFDDYEKQTNYQTIRENVRLCITLPELEVQKPEAAAAMACLAVELEAEVP